MSDVRVLPVPEGSIIWFHDVDFGDQTQEREALMLMHEAIGHDRFVVLHTNGGAIVDVLGPEELVARVRGELDDDPLYPCPTCTDMRAAGYVPTDLDPCPKCEGRGFVRHQP